MRVIVTGGAGFIGTNLVYALVAMGQDVLVVDDLSSGKPENIHPASDFRTMDILSPELSPAFLEFEPDAVVHLAAQSDVQRSIADPEADRRINVDGTRAVARATLDSGARRLLSASSAAVYGEPAELPLLEGSQKRPSNPYGESKLAAERLLIEELSGSGTDFASLRFSNVYGPRQDALGEGGVVAIFAAKTLAGATPSIFGTGSQTRDFIFVGDVVGAILELLGTTETLERPGVDGSAYNVSTGHETSVDMLALQVAEATGFASPFQRQPARPGDIERSVLDPTKVHEACGWAASTPMPRGIAQTVAWFAHDARGASH